MATAELNQIAQEVEVKKFKPSDIKGPFKKKYGLGAYALNGELAQDDGRADVYFAIKADKIQGLMVATRWTLDDIWGKHFWNYLKERFPITYKKVLSLSPLGINIQAIEVHPDARRQGLTKKFLDVLLLDYNPSFINAWTKNPSLVAGVAKTSQDYNMRTFFGNSEVTPDEPKAKTRVHEAFLKSDFRTRSGAWSRFGDTQAYLIASTLPKGFSDMSAYPSYIQASFKDLIEAESLAGRGNKMTAISFLISIRKELLP